MSVPTLFCILNKSSVVVVPDIWSLAVGACPDPKATLLLLSSNVNVTVLVPPSDPAAL